MASINLVLNRALYIEELGCPFLEEFLGRIRKRNEEYRGILKKSDSLPSLAIPQKSEIFLFLFY